jgi:hypothetical protein
LVECDGFVLGDGSQPFQDLQVAAAAETAVREQVRDLAGVRGLPVQRGTWWTRMRDVMVRGKGPASVLSTLAGLLLAGVLLSIVASRLFRWDEV